MFKKILILLTVIVFLGLVFVSFNLNSSKEKGLDNTQKTEQENDSISADKIPSFNKDMSMEEAQGAVYEVYNNNNLRLVGAIVQSVFEDHIIVKTYEAGPGTTSIVRERNIAITNDVPVFETKVSFEDDVHNSVTTRKDVSSLQSGDHIIVECSEDKSMKNSEELTAVLITKDVMEMPDDKLMLNKDLE